MKYRLILCANIGDGFRRVKELLKKQEREAEAFNLTSSFQKEKKLSNLTMIKKSVINY